jgi:catechol 2,3-dioxygenase-like lactoylglutathione lyase family enzyme
MIRGIHHVTVHVRDLDRMKQFYIDAFGFESLGYDASWANNPDIDEIVDVPGSAARSIMLSAGNCYLEIFQYNAPAPDDAMRPRKPYEHGYTHFCVDVTDIEAEVERLSKLGMSFTRRGGQGKPIDVGIVKAIYGQDPEGNLIELQETLSGCDFGAEKLAKANLVG